jgi:hypothetical protein
VVVLLLRFPDVMSPLLNLFLLSFASKFPAI